MAKNISKLVNFCKKKQSLNITEWSNLPLSQAFQRLAKDKHSSLFLQDVSEEKRFKTLLPYGERDLLWGLG
jgi:hypothetical protein